MGIEASAAPAPTASATSPASPGAPQSPPLAASTGMDQRGSDGRFLPKVEAQDQDKEPAKGKEAPKEQYRFRRQLKVYGETEDVDLDEDGLLRELQKGRALQKKAGVLTKAQRLVELAKQDPEGFLRELGHEPADIARRRLAEEARRGAMTPEEAAIEEAKAEAANYKAELERLRQADTERQAHAAAETARQEWVGHFETALKALGEAPSYEKLAGVAEIQSLALEHGVELTPEQAVKEYVARQAATAETWATSKADEFLSGKVEAKAFLGSLPKAFLEAVLKAKLAEVKARGVPTGLPAPVAKVEPEQAAPRKVLTEREVNENLRQLMRQR